MIRKQRSIFSIVLRMLPPLLLLAAGGAAWAYFQSTGPTAVKRERVAAAPVVRAVAVAPDRVTPTLHAMGTVKPARQITLRARVAGTVEQVAPAFTPGGLVQAGQELLRLDQRDYRIQVDKQRSAVAQAQAQLELEHGQQAVARVEMDYLKQTTGGAVGESDLALRKPQLKDVQAALDSAGADLAQAELDLSRTVVRAPFNAMLTERSVNLGSYVGAQDDLATLVGTDEYWIEASVPVDRLAYLDLGSPGGAPASVSSQSGPGQWSGAARRITGSLTESTRMATLLVTVKDPLGLSRGQDQAPGLAKGQDQAPGLILGDYVSLDIQCREMADAYRIPRSALRDQGRVWVVQGGRLLDRAVRVAWKTDDEAWVTSGLAPGELVVVSPPATAVQDMDVRVEARADGMGQS